MATDMTASGSPEEKLRYRKCFLISFDYQNCYIFMQIWAPVNKYIISVWFDEKIKFRWAFRMYDKDNSGSIELSEMIEIIGTLYEMEGVSKVCFLNLYICTHVSISPNNLSYWVMLISDDFFDYAGKCCWKG